MTKKILTKLVWPLTAFLLVAGIPKEVRTPTAQIDYTYPLDGISDTRIELIDEEFIKASITCESTWNPRAVSELRARGLMQLTYRAWQDVRPKLDYYENVFNPEENVAAGTDYLELIEEYCKEKHPNWDALPMLEQKKLLLAAYHGGKSRLSYRGFDISRMPKPTRDHVEKVIKEYNKHSTS